MTYTKHNFSSGDILQASQLNEIEDGIEECVEEVNDASSKVNNLITDEETGIIMRLPRG